MPEWFVDTSGWGNLFDTTQPYYVQTASLYRTARQQGQRFVTTNYVLTELVALLTSPLRVPRSQLIGFVNSVKASPYVEVIYVDAALDQQAWQLLTNRQDKAWSLVDCVSFVLMEQRSIYQALTTDHHFEQAGFIRRLK